MHPLYAIPAKKHFDIKPTPEFVWKSSSHPVPGYDAPRPEPKQGTKHVEQNLCEKDPRPPKAYTTKGFQTTNSYEDDMGGKATFMHHNRKSINEYNVENKLQVKHRVKTISE